MKTLEKIYTKQISTTLPEDVYQKWIQLCKEKDKTSFQALRELIEYVCRNDKPDQ